jgi:hypothetical protein
VNAAVGVLLPALGILTILSRPIQPPTTPAARVSAIALLVLAGIFMVSRVARARLTLFADGVKVINPVRTRYVRWEDIAGFSLRSWGIFFMPIGHVDLKQGSSIPVLGIQRSSPEIWRRRTSADNMIDELNQLREEIQRR